MNLEETIETVKQIVIGASAIVRHEYVGANNFTFSKELPTELKAALDFQLNSFIVESLSPLGIPILSEETPDNQSAWRCGLSFVIDPLDGTFNFIRKLGESAISVALMDSGKPIFGVVFLNKEQKLFWGGKAFGSFEGNTRLEVSTVKIIQHAALCTGFPVRLNKNDKAAFGKTVKEMTNFGKVRMLGSAAASLIHVARGSAEKYMESNIMIWDVAAGLAIVEGAGGAYSFSDTEMSNCLSVEASNGLID